MTQISEHFDEIAKDYDYFKSRNWYYYGNLKKLYRELIPEGQRVLEIGCGTGDLLAGLNPSRGVGVDISAKMIEIASGKHGQKSNLRFLTARSGSIKEQLKEEGFDYIFLADVIEHLEDVPAMAEEIFRLADMGTKVVISMANPLWEAALLVLEKLRLKMPEGPHYRIGRRKLEKIMAEKGFVAVKYGYRQLLPAYIPAVSDFINKYFYKLPLIRNFGLTMFWVFQKK